MEEIIGTAILLSTCYRSGRLFLPEFTCDRPE